MKKSYITSAVALAVILGFVLAPVHADDRNLNEPSHQACCDHSLLHDESSYAEAEAAAKKCSACKGHGLLTIKCPNCKGKGSYTDEESCYHCKGTGKEPQSGFSRTLHYVACKTCKGKKKVKVTSNCHSCSGSGKQTGKCAKCSGTGNA